ncbi:unnamed protein product [Rotaria sp. Silwood1]|nr:unnamed protein product [Rotaria sp. Silwood1]CAF1654467.1 unnamed protein product [Rotaria sp. Silwood1]CAF3797257.1 unnamed protein product [Rotaria sp. Silwood1]CAF3855135.1 unnamed protein product [Rotaria sp. Silwood1]CAF3878395.1 unnamed protein product [Rotaria sp. Silwood1]
MTDALCSCCQIFGQPKARVNFIILACGPDSVAYQRTTYLLQKYPETNTPIPDSSLTNYDTLMSINSRIHNLRNSVSEIDSSTTDSSDKCCYGFLRFPYCIDNSSDTSEGEMFQKHLLDLLNEKVDKNLQEPPAKVELPSWVLLYGSIYLEPVVLDIFINLKDQNVPLVTNTFAVLGLIVNEKQLFESWLCRNVAFEDYENNTYPKYEQRIEAFFSFLNSSKGLQEHTILIEESQDFNNNELQEILKHLFRQRSSKYSSINSDLRSSMKKLLKYRHRKVIDVKFVRGNLLKSYGENSKIPLESLVTRLKHYDTAGQAAREVIHLVVNEFTCVNKERKRAYKRQLLCGFNESDPQNSNTVAAQMIFYALRLLQNYDDATVPFLYAIIWVICKMVTHFVFRHELFNNTSEIFTLSLLLVSQQHYALVIGGLHLCSRILNADQNEHKYAGAYLKHDPLTARKILDAIKWLLSPFQQLRKLWDEKTDAK